MTARKEEVGPSGLASALVEAGALQSDWLPSYRAVPRDMFVPARVWPGIPAGTEQSHVVDRDTDPDAWLKAVYSDIPLTTQWDDGQHTADEIGTMPTSSNSRPLMVFSMLADLDVRDGQRALEIGTGTGWNAGLLSHRLGGENVVSVEFDAEVAKGASENLRNAGLSPLVIVGDGRLGYAGGAPYDRVIATCSIGEVPRAWIEQTVTGGVILAPWAALYGGEAIVRLTVDGETASGPFTRPSAFMRLRQHRADFPAHDTYLKGVAWPADGIRSTSALSPASVRDWVVQFAIGLQVPGAFWSVERSDEENPEAYTLWTYDADSDSWASADYEPGADSFEVVQSGPRKLWDETEAAYRWWVGQGRPDFERFGLTVSSEGERAWLDSPGNLVPLRSA
ncbi:protein-L-isoaspartate(D-aspartate) O-methyltransferase [Streptomyces albireticuli]|uniref:Protein-L-isoaspartate O-methyltransferase n=1 Tax=Streptomyces albireticuli TaxID=1940 RepID=A0A2A2D2R3_9ACTN|nr:protein-L-isoaspartate(D-aspartate) O-methyltransferase [Streptomyces albireticuli]MCD9196206.1 protein-L-isoaspartate(D-aspartate) O-methyltransferase [Streptomyces albireticuli]PAU46723.1 protein-L-isoaspartate(D-aspartate) O-methyltransferase [Streptomyces albireticuli]